MLGSETRVIDDAIGRPIAEVDTPALLLEIEAFDRNVRSMADECAAMGKALRPHIKSHKSPVAAHRQIAAGAVGITCAKISEAELMVAGGGSDLLISTVVGSPQKAERLCHLARRAKVTAVLDSDLGAGWLSEAASALGIVIDVLVDVNVGQNRTGLEPKDAKRLGEAVAKLPGLRLRGLQGYEGNLQHVYGLEERTRLFADSMSRLDEARAGLVAAGLPTDWVTTAGAGTYRLSAAFPFVTEVQPVSYVVMDADYRKVEGPRFETALSVLTTIIGRYGDRAIVDAGSKSVSTDAGQPVMKTLPGLRYSTAGDEHGKVVSEGTDLRALEVGAKIE